MFISQEDALWNKQGDLSDPAWCIEVCRRLRPECVDGWEPGKDPLGRNLCTLLIEYLDQIPPFEQLQKIGNKLREITAPYGAEILRLRWWDIGSSKRHLEVLVRRPPEVQTIVLLMWKKSDVAANVPRLFSGLSTIRPSWAFDPSAPGGWRFEIECEIFEHIKDAFDRWLASPRMPTTHHVMRSITTFLIIAASLFPIASHAATSTFAGATGDGGTDLLTGPLPPQQVGSYESARVLGIRLDTVTSTRTGQLRELYDVEFRGGAMNGRRETLSSDVEANSYQIEPS